MEGEDGHGRDEAEQVELREPPGSLWPSGALPSFVHALLTGSVAVGFREAGETLPFRGFTLRQLWITERVEVLRNGWVRE
ncbi:hypothetical protein GCM10020219_008410 [Nonomuraea dietziae]